MYVELCEESSRFFVGNMLQDLRMDLVENVHEVGQGFAVGQIVSFADLCD